MRRAHTPASTTVAVGLPPPHTHTHTHAVVHASDPHACKPHAGAHLRCAPQIHRSTAAKSHADPLRCALGGYTSSSRVAQRNPRRRPRVQNWARRQDADINPRGSVSCWRSCCRPTPAVQHANPKQRDSAPGCCCCTPEGERLLFRLQLQPVLARQWDRHHSWKNAATGSLQQPTNSAASLRQ